MSQVSVAVNPTRRGFASFVFMGILALFGVVAGQLVYIHWVLRPRLLEVAETQQWGRSRLPARRGMILDARGRVVALSRQMPDVFVDPGRAKEPESLVADLSARLNLSSGAVLARVRQKPGDRYVVVASRVDEAEAAAVRELGHPAVGLTDREVRSYPLGPSLAHVTGFVGKDGIGLDGVERAQDEHLRGKDGRRALLLDVRRRPLRRDDSLSVLPEDGGHVVLTIDAEVQRTVEEVLDDAIAEFEAESGVAVLMAVQNGEILALACRPSYDPTEASTVPENLRRNRALTDPVEPGSTIKPFIACGALEGGFIRLTDSFDCGKGERNFGTRVVKDTSPHGIMDLAGILTFSSNIGMALIGQRMGNRALHETVLRFGFGEPTGIDCPGEGTGKVRPLRNWSDSLNYSAVSVAMGYEVSVTPIQLISAFCALANGGTWQRPRIVKQLLSPDGQIAQTFESDASGRRIVSREVARIIAREMLVATVDHGTGRRAQLERFRVFGKTGTPKLLAPGARRYEPGAYQPIFVGAAPAADPKVAVLVMIRRPNPNRGYYGGVVAAPAGAKMLDWTLDYYGIPPDRATQLTGF
jgi:cell division protein FtsI (penicillin-binding protein 3)